MSIELQQRLLDFIRTGTGDFAALAMEVHEFQRAHNSPYRAYCERLNRRVEHWREIPAVPASAFKDFALTCFPFEEAVAEFHTSGTTRTKAGKHYFKTLELYNAAAVPNFEQHLLLGRKLHSLAGPADVRQDAGCLPPSMMILTPSPSAARHSSLAYMLGLVAGTDAEYFVENDTLMLERLTRRLCEARWDNQPVCLLGTAFAFVHLCDFIRESFTLASGSRIMETGGFKGRSREASKRELYQLMEKQLGVPPHRIVNEYGMTELSSQFYDESLLLGRQTDRKRPPPWTRVLIIDPVTGNEAPVGGHGLIRILDLANLWSCACLQTEDLGVAHADGTFEVLGRLAGAEVRGCSLNAEILATS